MFMPTPLRCSINNHATVIMSIVAGLGLTNWHYRRMQKKKQ